MTRSQRTRSARAIANDAAILDAAINEVLRVGVDHVSLRDVGHRAGLTHGATYARYEDVDELLVDLWNSALVQRASATFDLCMAAAQSPSARSVRELFEVVRDASPADVASVHLLLTARRIPTLNEEVEPFILTRFDFDPEASERDKAVFARGLTLFAMTMMQIFSVSQFGWDRDFQEALERLVAETLIVDPESVTPVALLESDDRVVMAPGDDLKAQLAYATFGVVGKSGYTRATISRIARRANCSPGAIYKLYPSKEDLVIAAFHDLMRARWMKVANFVDILEEGSLAQLLHASASVHNAVRQNFTLETTLAGAHNDKLRAAVLGQIAELEAIGPLINVSDEETDGLRYLVRSVVFLTVGVNFLSTVTNVTRRVDFNQFTEPFRRALLADAVPSWPHICQQILKAVQSGEIKAAANS
ncbi:MAG TPA: TetR/AcrR family transcriptional regulator [Acidimicrobiales bacterium]|jgi:AcrR family transcriptional regulator